MEETLDEKIARVLAQSRNFTDIRISPKRERRSTAPSSPVPPLELPTQSAALSSTPTPPSASVSAPAIALAPSADAPDPAPAHAPTASLPLEPVVRPELLPTPANEQPLSTPTSSAPTSPVPAQHNNNGFSLSSSVDEIPVMSSLLLDQSVEEPPQTHYSSQQSLSQPNDSDAEQMQVLAPSSPIKSLPSSHSLLSTTSTTPTMFAASSRASSTPKSRAKPQSLQPWSVSAESRGLITALQLQQQQPLMDKTAIYYQSKNSEERERAAGSRTGGQVWMQPTANDKNAFEHRRISRPASSSTAVSASTSLFSPASAALTGDVDDISSPGQMLKNLKPATDGGLTSLPMQALTGIYSVLSATGSIVKSAGESVDTVSQSFTGGLSVSSLPGFYSEIKQPKEVWSLSRPATSASTSSTQDCAVTVAARVRPFSVGEKQVESRRVVSALQNRLVLVNPSAFLDPDAVLNSTLAGIAPPHFKETHHSYVVDHCLWSYDPIRGDDEYCNQVDVFKTLAPTMLSTVSRGESVSCYAYGQTGSGKTHSLFGSINEVKTPPRDSSLSTSSSVHEGEEHGLCSRVFSAVIDNVQRSHAHDTTILFSFLEIYNDKMRDLLARDAQGPDSLRIRDHPTRGPYVEGLMRRPVSSMAEVQKMLQEGHMRRATIWSGWNPTATKSHVLATLELVPTLQFQAEMRPSIAAAFTSANLSSSAEQSWQSVKVHMCELAGSEAPEAVDTRGETRMISRTLSAVGSILSALARGEAPSKLVFRDSVLTRLVRDSMHSAGHCTLLATLSPAHGSYDESFRTMKFAERACHLKLRPARSGGESKSTTAPPRIARSPSAATSVPPPSSTSTSSSASSSSATSSFVAAASPALEPRSPTPTPTKLRGHRHPFSTSSKTRTGHAPRGESESKSSRNDNNDSFDTSAREIIPDAPRRDEAPRSAPQPPQNPSPEEALDAEMTQLFADELSKNYKALAGQHSDLQRELEDIRSDRDQMLQELQELYDVEEVGKEMEEERQKRAQTEKALLEVHNNSEMLLRRNRLLESELEKAHLEVVQANQARYSLQAELENLKSAAALVSQLQAQLLAAEARSAHWQQVATQVLTPGSSKREKSRVDKKEHNAGASDEVTSGADPANLFASTPSPDSKLSAAALDEDGAETQEVIDPAAKDALLAATLQENARLNVMVEGLQDDVKDARAQLLASQTSMHKEFSSLWAAVQELNKLDAVKEHHLSDLLQTKDKLTTQLGRAVGRCEELEREVMVMDRVLEDAVHLEDTKLERSRRGLTPASTNVTPKRLAANTGFPVSPQPTYSSDKYLLPAPPPGVDQSDMTPRRSGWKAAMASSPATTISSVGKTTPRRSTPTRGVLSRPPPGEELDQNALDRQLNLLSRFLVNDKSALRLQKLREKSGNKT